MEKVSLSAFIHNRQECIGIYFTMHTKLNDAIKKIPQIKWTKTYKCWYLPLTKENVTAITKAVDKMALLILNQFLPMQNWLV